MLLPPVELAARNPGGQDLQFPTDIATFFESIKAWILHIFRSSDDLLKEWPYWSLALAFFVFLGPWILLIPLLVVQAILFVVLYAIGFGLSGIIGGSPAALYQSLCYGGHTPSASLFAFLQSTGARYNVGTASNWVLACIRLLAGALGVYVLVVLTNS